MEEYQRQTGNFAVALGKVALAHQTFATPKEGIIDRMKKGVNSDACKRWAWFNASFNEVNGDILATRVKFNPLSVFDKQTQTFSYAQKAVDAMRTGEFYLTDNILLGNKPAAEVLLEIAEQDSKRPIHKKRVINLGKKKTHDVSTDCFADDDTIVFLAEGYERARNYGLFIRNAFGENSIPISKVYMQDLIGKNKSRGFALSRVDTGSRSYFNCYNRDLYYDNGSLFGGYESAKGTQKNCKHKIKTYTPAQARQCINIINGVMSGKQGTSRLEEVLNFFRQ
jgi:hypothetical protein